MLQAYLRYAICISVSISMGLAQQNPPARNLSFYLNVEVTDRDGKPVSDLQEQDFTLLDNKRPQKIVSFQAVRGGNQAPPTEVILLTDEVNTPLTTVAFERQELQKFLERDNGVLSHPMSLALLSDAGLKLSKPSQDGRTLIADLAANPAGLRVINSSQGVYGAADRLQRSLNAISQLIQAEGPKAARKLVVWISPGWAVLTGPAIQLSPKDRQGVFRNIVALSENLRNADITISSIDPLGASDSVLRTSFYTGFLKGVKKPSEAQFGNLALQVLAAQSGGRVLSSSNNVANQIAATVSDLDIYYVLKFDASSGATADDYHSLEVKIDKPGMTVRTRTGYYAQPDRR